MSEQRQTMNRKPVFTIPAKTIINFESGFKEKLLCDGPTFTAGNACPYSCSFCYVGSQMVWQYQPNGFSTKHGVTGEHMDIVVRRANPVEIVRKQLLSKGYIRDGKPFFRGEKKVIYASPLTDVAANMEFVKETVEICKVILELTNWDIRLLSKSNLLPKIALALNEWWFERKWGENPVAFYPKDRIIYGVSTGTLDDKLASAFEQGTPKVSKRIASLHWLQDNGFRTFGMICPSLPQTDYGKFSLDMAAALRVDKLEHVWAEVINTRGESFRKTHKALRDGGFENEAELLRLVSTDNDIWEGYARATFEAHTAVIPPNKLRYLQYVNKSNKAYWMARQNYGAVLLGKEAHGG